MRGSPTNSRFRPPSFVTSAAGTVSRPTPAPEDEADLRDEIEAEVEAATLAADDEDEQTRTSDEDERDEPRASDDDDDEDGEEDRPRRRRRRGGRGRRRGKRIEATFDHGDDDGYGLWLDASVKDNPVYAEHWAGHRQVEVTIDPDQIVIRRSDSGNGKQD